MNSQVGSTHPRYRPKWRNWQTRRTQDPLPARASNVGEPMVPPRTHPSRPEPADRRPGLSRPQRPHRSRPCRMGHPKGHQAQGLLPARYRPKLPNCRLWQDSKSVAREGVGFEPHLRSSPEPAIAAGGQLCRQGRPPRPPCRLREGGSRGNHGVPRASRPDSKIRCPRGAWVRGPTFGIAANPAAGMTEGMRIGILTGGGDVPGLNPCIKAVVNRVAHDGHEVSGSGAAGRRCCTTTPTPRQPSGSSRSTPRSSARSTATAGRSCTPRAPTPAGHAGEDAPFLADRRQPARGRSTSRSTRCGCSRHLGIDALIPIGGDDTLSYALRLHRGRLPVVAIPKTMDNDVYGTDYCIGFSTAVTRGVQFIHACARRPAPTSGSPSSSSSAATAARRR